MSELVSAAAGMPTSAYLGLSVAVFALGLVGVLVRRNPIMLLLAVELLLNAANLALVGFSRHWDDPAGQVFALVVMVVAAAEVVIGLGLVVAIFHQRKNLDVDDMTELSG